MNVLADVLVDDKELKQTLMQEAGESSWVLRREYVKFEFVMHQQWME